MKELMLCLLACSLAGALAGTGILLLKRLLRDKLSPNWHCYIWLLVMTLLLIPVPAVELAQPGEILAVSTAPEYAPEYVPEGYTEVELEVQDSPLSEVSAAPENLPPTVQTPVENLQKKTTIRLSFPSWGWTALGAVWLAGVVIFFGKQLWNYRKFVSKLNHTSRAGSLEMLILLKQTELDMNILRSVDLAVTSLPITPMIVGVKKPTLFLPDESLSDEQLRLIFVHELSHYQYGDLLYKELALILQGVHWFNPIGRIMTDDIDFSCELCCDRRVTRFIGAERSKEYSQLLLELLGMSFDRNTLSAAFSMDKSALKRRLALIVKPQKTSKMLAVLLAAVLALLGVACSSAMAPSIEIPVESEQKVEAPEQAEQLREWIAKNSDVVGWLQIPGTEIDAPVVQSSDNGFYYRRDELKQYSESGSFFADYQCQFGPTSEDLFPSTVIYGHNMSNVDDKDGERFSQLFHYADAEWAKEHPYIYFSTPEEDMLWEVFAVSYTTDSNYIQVLKDNEVSDEPITEEQMLSIVNTQREYSLYDYADVEVDGDDKILTLCTNTAKGKDMRFLVMAKLVTEDDKLVAADNVEGEVKKQEEQADPLSAQTETVKTSRDANLIFPLSREDFITVTAEYGVREGHKGIDLHALEGTEILAAADGVVLFADWQEDSGYGFVVEIEHENGWVTRYAHCKEVLVSVGEDVKAGQTIATVGASGNVTGFLVHFEVQIGDACVNPRPYLWDIDTGRMNWVEDVSVESDPGQTLIEGKIPPLETLCTNCGSGTMHYSYTWSSAGRFVEYSPCVDGVSAHMDKKMERDMALYYKCDLCAGEETVESLKTYYLHQSDRYIESAISKRFDYIFDQTYYNSTESSTSKDPSYKAKTVWSDKAGGANGAVYFAVPPDILSYTNTFDATIRAIYDIKYDILDEESGQIKYTAFTLQYEPKFEARDCTLHDLTLVYREDSFFRQDLHIPLEETDAGAFAADFSDYRNVIGKVGNGNQLSLTGVITYQGVDYPFTMKF